MKNCLTVQLNYLEELAEKNFPHPIQDSKNKNRSFLEGDVRRFIINPILKCLGWKFKFEDLILDDEYNIYSGTAEESVLKYGRVDYAYIHEGKFRIFIEAKKCSESLDKHIGQIERYIKSVPSIDLIALTNAHEWRFFSPDTNPSYLNFLNLKVNENTNKEISKHLIELLSKKNIVSGKTCQIVKNHQKKTTKTKETQNLIFNHSINGLNNISCELKSVSKNIAKPIKTKSVFYRLF